MNRGDRVVFKSEDGDVIFEDVIEDIYDEDIVTLERYGAFWKDDLEVIEDEG